MKFSIITCTRNSQKTLERNIASVETQALEDWEHIFIDGNSSDKTIEIIQKYQAKHPDKVKFFQYAPQGISNAMNWGIKHSSGEYLIHLHSDDSFYGNSVLEEVDDIVAHSDYDWIYAKINVTDDAAGNIGFFPTKKIFHSNSNCSLKNNILKYYNFIPHQSVFIKKQVFDKFGYFDETLKSSMDPDLWLRIRNKTKWSFFDLVVSNFSLGVDAQSSGIGNRVENKKNYEIVQRRYLNKFEFFLAKIINYIFDKLNSNYRNT